MSDDGNGNGDFITPIVFDQFKTDQASLCKAYRNHFETKITNMEKNIKGRVNIVGVTLGLVVTVLTLVNVYLSLVGS